MLGDHVALLDGARINVSGDEGGGVALVGGNYQGNGPEQNAIGGSHELHGSADHVPSRLTDRECEQVAAKERDEGRRRARE